MALTSKGSKRTLERVDEAYFQQRKTFEIFSLYFLFLWQKHVINVIQMFLWFRQFYCDPWEFWKWITTAGRHVHLLFKQWTWKFFNIRRKAFSVNVTAIKSPYDTHDIYNSKQVKYQGRVPRLFAQLLRYVAF